MRIRNATRLAFDGARFSEAVKAGHISAILQALEQRAGIVFDSRAHDIRGVLPRVIDPETKAIGDLDTIAMDAQPQLVTVSNAGIPAFLTNYLDPKLIEVLVSPMKAAVIAGETKKGDWTTTVATFPVIESDGEVSSYGDFNSNGSVNANANFPQRQSYHYQTFTQWGEKELAVAALAKIDWASRLNIASALVLNKYQNLTYFFGVAGLQNYGLLNDPALPASIAPTTTWNNATGDVIYTDWVRLFQQLQTQANGTIDAETRMTAAMSPVNAVNLNKTNQYNVNVYDQLKKNFPNLRIETAPEYSTTSGELVQLIVDEVDGQETLTAAFTEKMRAHAMVTDTSSFKQKKSQGTWGTVIFRPVYVASMLG
jgi:hypothetical protein